MTGARTPWAGCREARAPSSLAGRRPGHPWVWPALGFSPSHNHKARELGALERVPGARSPYLSLGTGSRPTPRLASRGTLSPGDGLELVAAPGSGSTPGSGGARSSLGLFPALQDGKQPAGVESRTEPCPAPPEQQPAASSPVMLQGALGALGKPVRLGPGTRPKQKSPVPRGLPCVSSPAGGGGGVR